MSNNCALCPRGVLPLRASDHLHRNLWCRTSAHLLHRSGTHPREQPLNNILNIDCTATTTAWVNQHQCGKEHATGLGIISLGGRGCHSGTVAPRKCKNCWAGELRKLLCEDCGAVDHCGDCKSSHMLRHFPSMIRISPIQCSPFSSSECENATH